MPRKSGAKSDAKTSIADALGSTVGGVVGPTRGGQSTRGGKRRRASNNNSNSSNGTEIYGSGTIIASNPFDDDHHNRGQTMMTGKMACSSPSMQPQVHHFSHHHHNHHHSQHQLGHLHPTYSPVNHHHQFLHQPHQSAMMASPQSHYSHQIGPDRLINHSGHMVSGHVQQGFGQPLAPSHNHMIGAPSSPQIMGPAPSHSPYMLPLATTPTAATTPPTPINSVPNQEMILMQQQQPYAPNHAIYCGKCQIEIYQQDQSHIICRASCGVSYHISCSGLTQLASDLLMKENMAEWLCDRCMIGNPQVPLIKYKQQA